MNSSTSSSAVSSLETPFSAAASRPTSESSAESGRWKENVYAALPLFIVGGACCVVAAEFYLTGAVTRFGDSGSVGLRPWVLFLALGITGLAAGIVTLFTEPEPSATGEPEPVVAPVPTAPEWDESGIELGRGYVPQRPMWASYPGCGDGGASPAGSDDPVLQEFDEIASALQKKKGDSPPPS